MMTVTIEGRVYGPPSFDDPAHPSHVMVRIFAKDPDNPLWLLDAHAHADGPLAQKIAAACSHGTHITATGLLRRTAPVPADQTAGNTAATLDLTAITLAP